MLRWLKKRREVGALQIAISLRELHMKASESELAEFNRELARQAHLAIKNLGKNTWRDVIGMGGRHCERFAKEITKAHEATRPSLSEVSAVVLMAIVTRLVAENSSHGDDVIGRGMIDDEIQAVLQFDAAIPWSDEK